MNSSKRKYLFLISIIVIGIVAGVVFANILGDSDRILVEDKLISYFTHIKNGQKLNYLNNFLNSFLNNCTYLIIIWILGLSIIGLVGNVFVIFFKAFVTGFSVGSIINIYLYKGLIGALLYIFPHVIINLFIFLMLTYYANNFSIRLFKLLFLKKDIKFSEIMRRYLKILLYSFIALLISSLLETFLSPVIIKLFTFLL